MIGQTSRFLEIQRAFRLLHRPDWYAPGAGRSCLQAGVSSTDSEWLGIISEPFFIIPRLDRRNFSVVETSKILHKKAFRMVIRSSPLTRMCSGYIVRSYWMLLT